MSIFIYKYTYTYIYTCIYTYIYTYVYIYMCVCVYVFMLFKTTFFFHINAFRAEISFSKCCVEKREQYSLRSNILVF